MNSDNELFNPELPDIMKSLGEFYMVAHTDCNGAITFTNQEFLKSSKWTPKTDPWKDVMANVPRDRKRSEASTYNME